MNIFNILVHDPLYNALIFLYNTVAFHDFGLAILFTTVLLKLILIPFSQHQIESQKKIQELQPKIKELQQKYKNEKEKQAQELMKLYKENKVNPLGGCLPLIVQIVFFIALWNSLSTIFGNDFSVNKDILYAFVSDPGKINQTFLGFLDLKASNIYLAVITAVAQFWQMKMMMQKQPEKKEKTGDTADMMQSMNTQMLYIFPALTLFIGAKFSAGLVLYWLISTVFMIVQQYALSFKKKM